MNTSDENAKEVSQDAAGEVAKTKEDGSAGVITLFFFIGFIASLILGWVIFPKLLYSQKKQPFDFNHAFHVETVDNGCESCHFFREDGSFSGAPKLAQCIDCHEETRREDPKAYGAAYARCDGCHGIMDGSDLKAFEPYSQPTPGSTEMPPSLAALPMLHSDIALLKSE